MRVAFHDHGGKGRPFATALMLAGHDLVGTNEVGDMALIDHDFYADICDRHEVTVLYPHGGSVILDWDGRPIHPHVRAVLVPAPGYVEVMAAYGFDRPCHVVGWPFCDLSPPRFPDAVERILFAPMHPLSNGYLGQEFFEANRRAFEALLATGREVTVRCWGNPAAWGLDDRLPATWTRGGSLATDDIDAADLVVSAEGTVLSLAVARGAPTLTYGSDLLPDLGHTGPVHPPRWADYAYLLRYPYDLEAEAWTFDELVAAVTRPSTLVDDWRRRFVGEPFDPAAALTVIESLDPARVEVAS